MDRRLIELEVRNFRSLRQVRVPLGSLNVLVGPNGAGKTNLLQVFRFLADVIRTDLEPALELHGGFDHVVFWHATAPPSSIRIRLKATWTARSSLKSPDEYELLVRRGTGRLPFARRESFQFRGRGGPRRIVISGRRVSMSRDDEHSPETSLGINPLSSGLSTLPRLSEEDGGEVRTIAQQLASFRVFDVVVDAARQPSNLYHRGSRLRRDASNLAAFLLMLHDGHEDAWERLVEDAIEVLPQLEGIDFEYPSGAAREVIAVLHERRLGRATPLADASYGTIRLLGLLAMLYDPNPPALTCVEEIDHGLHPQALELLVERIREASERTQFLIATHSPAIADRLKPEELIVCERRDDGSSAIPAISTDHIREIVAESEGLPLGDLWFSGALGGDL